MKKVYLFLLIGIVFIAAVFPPSQRKVALIIAIGEYPEGGKWRNLSSMNDVKYVKDALIKTGFSVMILIRYVIKMPLKVEW
jgi:hypothetical protein